jgi:hypothetical protein
MLTTLRIIQSHNAEAFTNPKLLKPMLKDLLKNEPGYKAVIRWLDISLTELDAYTLLKKDIKNNEDFARHNLIDTLIKIEGAPKDIAEQVIGYLAVLAGFDEKYISSAHTKKGANKNPGAAEKTVINESQTDEPPKFRYIGSGGHPPVILVNIAPGEVFTIGRYDASIGAKRSNFEFDKRTKAVSRIHMIIRRNKNGYFMGDLNSSAGTYINGKRLQPGTAYKLEPGSRVSFGHLGADYIWEE